MEEEGVSPCFVTIGLKSVVELCRSSSLVSVESPGGDASSITIPGGRL